MLKLADLMELHADELALAEARDNGSTIISIRSSSSNGGNCGSSGDGSCDGSCNSCYSCNCICVTSDTLDTPSKSLHMRAGKAVSVARAVDVVESIETLRYYAGWADKLQGKQIPLSTPHLCITRHVRV